MARHAADVPERHASLLPNFPPAQSGKYERGQAEEFARLLTIQWLVSSHPDFMRGLDDALIIDRFPGVLMHAYLMFWRFYLGRRTPNATSDLGDQSHARFYPCCSILVVEIDAANTLRQIQQHTDLLDGVRIMTPSRSTSQPRLPIHTPRMIGATFTQSPTPHRMSYPRHRLARSRPCRLARYRGRLPSRSRATARRSKGLGRRQTCRRRNAARPSPR